MNWLRKLTARSALFRRLPRLLRKGRIPIIVIWATMIFWVVQTRWFASLSIVDEIEQTFIDKRFQQRGNVPGDPNVVIVGINDSSLEQKAHEGLAADSEAIALMVEQRFPWNRKVWAILIERLMQSGAKTVALDLILDGDNPGSDALAAVVAKYRDRLVLGARFVDVTADGNNDNLTYTMPATSIIGEGDNSALVGSCLLRSEIDQAIRRFDFRTSEMREFWLISGKGFEDDSDDIVSFAPLAVAKFTGQPAPHGYRQPIAFQGRATTYIHLPMEEVLADTIFSSDPKFAGGRAFKDKLVFIGPIAEIMHDIHNTPFGPMPGVEIHAQIAGALLSGRTLGDAPPGAAFWLTLGVSIGSVALLIFCRQALTQSAILAVLTIALAIAAQMLFTRAATLIPVAQPTFALFGIGVFGVLFTVAIEQLEKARIRGVLDQYVSKNVADVVLKHSEDFEQMMRGERRSVTIVFSDVRGFTSIFESTDAVALVEQLNEYFEQMVACIQRQGGTLQKFIGDAIMAAWGDTHSLGHGEDAARAVRSALAMHRALRALNVAWKLNPARVPMRTGIGVNHGEVVVGEVGSQGVRKEFTLLGDAVNSAARFESATKHYHVDLLVGGDVERLTRGAFVFRCVDLSRFMGKKKPVETFTVLSDSATPAPAWLAPYHEAIAHYRAQRWGEAGALFREANAQLGGDDFLCGMYLERIADFEKSPPSAEWDGAYTMTEK